MNIALNVNNGDKLEMMQAREDGPIYVKRVNNKNESELIHRISSGDMVTLLNWYQYQKSIGNSNLIF